MHKGRYNKRHDGLLGVAINRQYRGEDHKAEEVRWGVDRGMRRRDRMNWEGSQQSTISMRLARFLFARKHGRMCTVGCATS